jgi:hypothetical protein
MNEGNSDDKGLKKYLNLDVEEFEQDLETNFKNNFFILLVKDVVEPATSFDRLEEAVDCCC